MDSRLNKDKTELGVLVFAIDLQMLANGDRLFDEVPKVLRDGWAKSYPQTKGILWKAKKRKKEYMSEEHEGIEQQTYRGS